MARPYRQLRAQMSPDAQAQAAAKAQALLAALEAESVPQRRRETRRVPLRRPHHGEGDA